MIHITVGVCTHNRQEMLHAALMSLVNLRRTPSFSFDIVVVDDASSDRTADCVSSAANGSTVPIHYYRHDVNRGVAAARNTCIRQAQGNWIAFFDDDEIADEAWLVSLLETAQRTAADCIAGPYLVKVAGRTPPACIRRLVGEHPVMQKPLPDRRPLDPRRSQARIPAAIGTGNVLIRKSLFERVGMFSEDYRRGEDIHFFMRAQLSGARFAVAPNAIIYHIVPPDRLESHRLMGAADLGGAVNGAIDVEVSGVKAALKTAVMRAAHLMIWTVPNLIITWMMRDRDRTLGRICSARFARSYIRTVLSAVNQHESETRVRALTQ